MHIVCITCEGFKSYAYRTVISGFHPQFNAITGFNGSGKSNILDAICFVLGITNLSQVRAGKLQDLIFKQGQAQGITKASVTIQFDNSDAANSPTGYQNNNKISVTRTIQSGESTKYLINGKNVKPKQVQDLFRSVQLNINNPHFLIMQGRITKVLNMKPHEILSMVKEASGTKMYEDHKEDAIKRMDKKEKQLNEVDNLLRDEINPTLDKLSHEKSAYLDFKKTELELRALEHFSVAMEYFTKEEFLENATEEINELIEEIQKLKKLMEAADDKVANYQPKINALKSREENEMGGGLRDLEKQVAATSKEFVKVDTSFKNFEKSLLAEREGESNLKITKSENEKMVVVKEKELAKEMESFSVFQQDEEEKAKIASAKDSKLQVLRTGVADDDDTETLSLNDQLAACKQSGQDAILEQNQAACQIKSAEADLKKKSSQAKSAEKALSKTNKEIDVLTEECQTIEGKLKQIDYSAKEKQNLVSHKDQLVHTIQTLEQEVDMLQAKLSRVQFNYTPPSKNFDQSKVKGMVVRLIKLEDQNFATALEVAAGGRLYNVVVDNQNIGKELLSKGKLRNRVTIIPLDKIAARSLDDQVIQRAKQVGGEANVTSALSIIGYDEELEKAMRFVFGGSLICKDADTAKKVTFHKNVRARSVTMDGDVYEPSGTLTGGARSLSASVIKPLQQLNKKEEELALNRKQLQQVDKALHKMETLGRDFMKYEEALGLKTHQLNLAIETRKSSPFHQQLEELENLKTQIKEETLRRENAVVKEKEAKMRSQEIEKELKSFTQDRDAQLLAAEKEVKKAKDDLKKASKIMKEKLPKVEAIKFEIEELKNEILANEEQLIAMAKNILSLEEEREGLLKIKDEKQALYDEAFADHKEKMEKLQAMSSERRKIQDEMNRLQKEQNDSALKVKEQSNALDKLQAQKENATNTIKELLKTHKWISTEKKHFGEQGGNYDFDSPKFSNYKKEINNLRKKLTELKANINMKVMSMFDEVEAESKDLIKKKDIVKKDRETINKTIHELDEKKNATLKETFEEVNSHFGSIFSMLLPGTQAKLAPPEGKTILEGLEVKVAFGKKWKESLTELSGGQRSLVALSLILALLRYKPAPMYILDEVDAALDLSHTQNIGKMLREHFSNSQFIVVSLKEGMFNNANVLFRTEFKDGISTVSRIAREEEEDQENERSQVSSRKHQTPVASNRSKKALAPRNA